MSSSGSNSDHEDDARRGRTSPTTLADSVAALERAHRHLRVLYDVSKLLTRFESVERTIPEVVAVVAQMIALRSAIVVIETADATQTLSVWRAPGEDASRLVGATEHAQAAYRYLVRPRVAPEREASSTFAPPRPEQDGAERNFVVIPLVIGHGRVFGALQFEGAGSLEEAELVVLNAVANQVAIAVDRASAIDARQAAAETGEREQRLLAEMSSQLAASLEPGEVLATLARFTAAHLADLCVIEVGEHDEHGDVRRHEVRFADETRQQHLAERLRWLASTGALAMTRAVLASGAPLVVTRVTDPVADGVVDDEAHAELIRAAGLESVLAVPIRGGEATLGVIVFASVDSARRYSTRDLRFAEEIAFVAALAVDNARLYQRAQRATRARQDLLSIVSHDLRNPLGAIMMSLAALRHDLEGEKRDRLLASLERSASGMKRLLEDLLDTASIEAGRISVEPRALEVAPVVSEALEALQPLAASKRIELRCDLAARLPAILADPSRFEQVLANLAGNAIKFTPEGGCVTVRAEPTGDMLTFAVSDTGVGIAQEDLAHVFERFWQADRRERRGTGLGLFIVKRIVEAHGGEVRVESSLGEGSTIFFTMPVAPS